MREKSVVNVHVSECCSSMCEAWGRIFFCKGDGGRGVLKKVESSWLNSNSNTCLS